MRKLLSAAVMTAGIISLSEGYELENISIYSAYGSYTDIKQITSPSEIITGKEIEEKKPFDLKELIKNRSGISFSSNGGFGQTTSIYLWGNKTENTVFMIDGIRINDPTTIGGNPFYELFLMDDIQQIEIVKGVQSGVWGADAVGGVINIVSKKPEKGFHIKTYGLYGSYITRKYGTTISYGSDRIDLLLGIHHLRTSGFSAAEPSKKSPDYGKRWDELGWERDPFRNDTLNLKTSFYITDKDRFEFVFKNIDAVVHYDAASGIDAKDYDDPFGFGISEYFNHISQRFHRISYRKDLKKHSIEVSAAKSEFKRTQYGGYEGEYRDYTFKDRYSFRKGFIIYGITRQDFINSKSAGFDLNKRYHSYGYFITSVYRSGNTTYTGSFRYDSYSAFKDKGTYKIGFKHRLSKRYFISGNYGTAYKVPTIFQLYGFAGNPDLNPENTKQYDISFGSKHITLTYFRYSIKDLIDYDFTTYKYKNIKGRSKIKGFEAKYSRFIKRFKTFISVNYTYLDPKDPDGNRLLRRPQNRVGFELSFYPSRNLDIGFYGEYVGKRKDTGGVNTGYYTVVDCFLNYRINRNITVYGKVVNLTDKYYQTVDGYATAERSLYAGIELRW
ncbi:MAG TPA: TonB-dependent receptor [Persephonella sp.]|uniref:TonB-dependent receptor n=1 Tax=Persephonella marina (strain DSM 14350 / EX-H1) TaxID=123214 RepID=C0QS10_PERMH|nr:MULTISPECIES: TonB-dependent receptor [Persephonella]ACO03932.1 TonB-dependent receptor [Persephonella marina EX-H1]HCB69201.1 TonB-dependent receptor [Persephonella sp.]